MSADIGESVRNRIRSRTAVTNLVGNRIFADVRDQKTTMPAVVVFITGNDPHEDLTGTNRIYASTVRVLCYAKERDVANDLAQQIRDDALPPNLRGRVEGMEWVECSLIEGPTEGVERPEDGSDNWLRITDQTFVIWNSAV